MSSRCSGRRRRPSSIAGDWKSGTVWRISPRSSGAVTVRASERAARRDLYDAWHQPHRGGQGQRGDQQRGPEGRGEYPPTHVLVDDMLGPHGAFAYLAWIFRQNPKTVALIAAVFLFWLLCVIA